MFSTECPAAVAVSLLTSDNCNMSKKCTQILKKVHSKWGERAKEVEVCVWEVRGGREGGIH